MCRLRSGVANRDPRTLFQRASVHEARAHNPTTRSAMLFTLSLLSALNVATPADSLAGTWKFTNEVQGVSWSEVCTIKQTGATMGGSCVGDAGASFAITGEVKGDSVTFQHAGAALPRASPPRGWTMPGTG